MPLVHEFSRDFSASEQPENCVFWDRGVDGISFTVHPCTSFSFLFLSPKIESGSQILQADEFLHDPFTCIFPMIFARSLSHRIGILLISGWSVGHGHGWFFFFLEGASAVMAAPAVEDTRLAMAAGSSAGHAALSFSTAGRPMGRRTSQRHGRQTWAR